jgi:anti-sigma regulatory factor (Ser/Thr protein kinase)
MALRAYALQDPSPVSVMQGVHRLVDQLPVPEMVTLMYLLFDPATRRLRFASAGHPPALVFGSGESAYLEGGLAPPLGVTAHSTFTEATHTLAPGATLLLFTDGLVERRGMSIQVGLDRLAAEAVANAASDLEELCDRLLSNLVQPDNVADDIALVAMRPVPIAGGPLRLRLPAEPRMLVQMRAPLRRWLRECDVADTDESEILVAVGEACANVVHHAYHATPGHMEIEARLEEGSVRVSVRDQGQWRPPAERDGGWGLQLMSSLMDVVEVDRGPDGTEVRMRRRVRIRVGT